MRRKKIKKEIDEQLLDVLIAMNQEWKQLQYLVENSIEPTDEVIYKEMLAKAKYLFLLREAKERNITAIRFYS